MDKLTYQFNEFKKIDEKREKIDIKASEKVTNNGIVYLIFSEALMSQKELTPFGLNLTQVNVIKDEILNLTYIINSTTFNE